MKHYVVVLDWAVEDDEAVTILGVAHTFEEAKKIFDENLPEQKGYTEEYGYEVYVDDVARYEAAVSGHWRTEHVALYIDEVWNREDNDYTPSSENGDYSPSNPWDAPGMKMSDFI